MLRPTLSVALPLFCRRLNSIRLQCIINRIGVNRASKMTHRILIYKRVQWMFEVFSRSIGRSCFLGCLLLTFTFAVSLPQAYAAEDLSRYRHDPLVGLNDASRTGAYSND